MFSNSIRIPLNRKNVLWTDILSVLFPQIVSLVGFCTYLYLCDPATKTYMCGISIRSIIFWSLVEKVMFILACFVILANVDILHLVTVLYTCLDMVWNVLFSVVVAILAFYTISLYKTSEVIHITTDAVALMTFFCLSGSLFLETDRNILLLTERLLYIEGV